MRGDATPPSLSKSSAMSKLAMEVEDEMTETQLPLLGEAGVLPSSSSACGGGRNESQTILPYLMGCLCLSVCLYMHLCLSVCICICACACACACACSPATYLHLHSGLGRLGS